MKRLMTDWEWLSIRILILGLTVFMWSYITEIEGVTEVFGDKMLKKYSWDDEMELVWGFRHYVYTITFGILTVIQALRICKWIKIRDKDEGFEIKCTNEKNWDE